MIALFIAIFCALIHCEDVDEGSKICEACLKYVLKLHDYLIETVIDPFETYVLDSVCTHLPQSYAEKCVEAVQTESKKIRDEVDTKFNNEKFCTEKVFIKFINDLFLFFLLIIQKLCKNEPEVDFDFYDSDFLKPDVIY